MPIDTRRPSDVLGDSESSAIRASLLQTYARFGERIAEMASRSLKDTPLSRRDAQKVLQAAATLSEARKSAFASAGLRLAKLRDRSAVRERRHVALLKYCADVVSGSTRTANDSSSINDAAEQLHDCVRAFLDKRGRWPILNVSEFEAHAKPAVLMLAAWSDDGR